MCAAAARAFGNSLPHSPQATGRGGAAPFLDGFAGLRARFASVLTLAPLFGLAFALLAAFWGFVAAPARFSVPSIVQKRQPLQAVPPMTAVPAAEGLPY